MPRNPYTPSDSPVHPAPDPLLRFIQRAQVVLVNSRRREGRLPLHDSFRLTLGTRSRCVTRGSSQGDARNGGPLQPTVHVDGTSNQQNAWVE